MGDSVPEHTGPISLTDTHPRTEHLQNPTATAGENRKMESLFLRDAQAVGRCNCWASNSTPFLLRGETILMLSGAFYDSGIVVNDYAIHEQMTHVHPAFPKRLEIETSQIVGSVVASINK